MIVPLFPTPGDLAGVHLLIQHVRNAASTPANLPNVLFGIFLVSALAADIYFVTLGRAAPSLEPLASSFLRCGKGPFVFAENLARVVDDFRQLRFYKPWGRKEPIVIRDPDHMQELSDNPHLSQRAVYSDIFGFKYTMAHATKDLDPNEQTAARYRLYSRAIRMAGVDQLPQLQPYLQAKLEEVLGDAVDSRNTIDGWVTVELASVMKGVANGMMGVYFFGEKLSAEAEFSWALRRYYKDVIRFMGALQIVPSFLEALAHSFITSRGRALNILFARLKPAVDSTKGGWEEKKHLKSITLLHNLIELSKDSDYWTAETLIQAVVGMWFAASHQPWVYLHFLALELCARPEYVELLRHEIDAHEALDCETISSLPVLDSFIKECTRLNPMDKLSIRRKALKNHTFSNGGPVVGAGEIACVSCYDIMHDEAKYYKPYEFDGLRFVKNTAEAGEMRGSHFTDASKDFPVWGIGSKVCPGRWHASLVIKMAIAHLVKKYDFRLEDEHLPQKWFWETFQMPFESTKVSFRARVR